MKITQFETKMSLRIFKKHLQKNKKLNELIIFFWMALLKSWFESRKKYYNLKNTEILQAIRYDISFGECDHKQKIPTQSI